jgi:hypothetical protein
METEPSPETQPSTIDLSKWDSDQNILLEPESELLTPNVLSEKLASTTERVNVEVAPNPVSEMLASTTEPVKVEVA